MGMSGPSGPFGAPSLSLGFWISLMCVVRSLTKDITLIMQLLRDNLTLWTSDMQSSVNEFSSNSIYALGDCATINQRKVMKDISAIFQKADKDKSGTLTVKEFQEALDDICDRYPQVKLYLNNKQMSSLVDLLKESKGDVSKEPIELNVEEFKSPLSQVDSQMKNLPATAQVATQQGSYRADCFNRMEECTKNPEGFEHL
ncbi:putative NADH:ubiquinone reductase (non-electrogenic) [Helianthus debilis subsp. tardiflorus]